MNSDVSRFGPSTLISAPNLSAVEATALSAMLVRLKASADTRNGETFLEWLDTCFDGDATVPIDALAARCTLGVTLGDPGVGVLAFSGVESWLLDTALLRGLESVADPDAFVVAFGVDRRRAQHLRMGLRRDRAASRALGHLALSDGHDRVYACLSTARVLRRERPARYLGVRDLWIAPEMQLYSDVVSLAGNRPPLSLVRGNPEQARVAYADDLRRAVASGLSR